MCGITGYVEFSRKFSAQKHRDVVTSMADRMHHRGPDSGGIWIDEARGVALGHRRLAIVDLTEEGHQPMKSADGRYVIVYNGEVYNFPVMRQELESRGHVFRGTSDTEVILAAITEWGLESAITRFNGMFAFALWDTQKAYLHLVRDRLGIKPLYYGWAGETFLFGSELKALCQHPHFTSEVDRDSLTLYLRYGYIPAPYTIYKGIHKLEAARILTLNSAREMNLLSYWSAQEVAQSGVESPVPATSSETAIEQLETLLLDAVKIRMIADVPLGAFLSGGIDSSTVVALMQEQSTTPVKTFSIGFFEEKYNEAHHAKAVAEHLKTDHTELYVEAKSLQDIIPRLPELYDEPFADPSQIPTFIVSQLTRNYVTVSLSGDGGDELFAGYPRYRNIDRFWQKLQQAPGFGRNLMAYGLSAVPANTWHLLFSLPGLSLPSMISRTLRDDRIQPFVKVLRSSEPQTAHHYMVSHWKSPALAVVNGKEPVSHLTNRESWIRNSAFIEWMQAIDIATYLVDDLLVKVDRASMGVSLEARVPLLDHRVVEFVWRIPYALKFHEGNSKWILRQILYRRVPRQLIERPNQGFEIPLQQWLRTSLRDWAENLLDDRKLKDAGYLEPKLIRQYWEDHQRGNNDWGYLLWDVLMFQAWLDAN